MIMIVMLVVSYNHKPETYSVFSVLATCAQELGKSLKISPRVDIINTCVMFTEADSKVCSWKLSYLRIFLLVILP